jgi:hypothetical protein
VGVSGLLKKSAHFLVLTADLEVSRQGAFDAAFIFKFDASLLHLTHLGRFLDMGDLPGTQTKNAIPTGGS